MKIKVPHQVQADVDQAVYDMLDRILPDEVVWSCPGVALETIEEAYSRTLKKMARAFPKIDPTGLA